MEKDRFYVGCNRDNLVIVWDYLIIDILLIIEIYLFYYANREYICVYINKCECISVKKAKLYNTAYKSGYWCAWSNRKDSII